MDFLNEFSKRFSNVARSVSEKSKENPELARLNGEVKAAEAALEKLYARYGEACYALKAGRGDAAAVEKLAVRVQAALLALEELTARRDAARELKRCANCGAVHPAQARFCSSCGKRLPEDAPKPEPAPEAQYCKNCGAERAEGDVRCPVCGADFASESPEEAPAADPEPVYEGPDIEEPTDDEARQWE